MSLNDLYLRCDKEKEGGKFPIELVLPSRDVSDILYALSYTLRMDGGEWLQDIMERIEKQV